MRRLTVAFGTRPEVIKLAPVVRALRARGFAVRAVATGQHDDPAMAGAFYAELACQPDVRWRLAGDGAGRLAALVERAERELDEHRPDLLVVLGDTNSVPALCLAARRHVVPVAHLEAGLRSRNETSTEEVNRKVAAACASLHLAPTELAADFLRAEGIEQKRIFVVGNPVIDALRERAIAPLEPSERSGALVTAHRATNVDDPARLERVVDIVERVAAEVGEVAFPVHPRTRARLGDFGLAARLKQPGIELLEPLGYDDLLRRLASALVVVTDSGGLQEEASYFGVPVVVLRRSTPRWEGVVTRTSRLVGLDGEAAIEAVRDLTEPAALARAARVPCPYGDGHTAERVAELLAAESTWELVALEEPDFVPARLSEPVR